MLREAPKYIQTAIGARAFIGRRISLETHVEEAPGPSQIGTTARALQATMSGRRNQFPTPPRDALPQSQSSYRPRTAALPQSCSVRGGGGFVDASQAQLKKSYLNKSRWVLIHGLARTQLLSVSHHLDILNLSPEL